MDPIERAGACGQGGGSQGRIEPDGANEANPLVGATRPGPLGLGPGGARPGGETSGGDAVRGAVATGGSGSGRSLSGEPPSTFSFGSGSDETCSSRANTSCGHSARRHLTVHHASTAETLVVPTNVRNFLDDYYEANHSTASIYRQAVVASRALRSVGQEPGDEPLGAPEARQSSKRRRARARAAASRRVTSPSPSTGCGIRHRGSAARLAKRKERASTKRQVEIFTEQCGAVTGRLARSRRVYDGKRAAASSVFCGRAMVIQDLHNSCVVWAAVIKDEPHYYCSCHGRREAELVTMQMKRGLSSTCKHAFALGEAHKNLASAFGYSGLAVLYARYPYLINKVDSGRGEPVTEHVANLRNQGELHVVCADDLWATVEKPPTAARNQRVFCLAPLCRSSNRVSIHARAVSPPGAAQDDGNHCDGSPDGLADEVS